MSSLWFAWTRKSVHGEYSIFQLCQKPQIEASTEKEDAVWERKTPNLGTEQTSSGVDP